MRRPFPKHKYLAGNFAPTHFEAETNDVPVHGEIPKDLLGALYRNGPNPQFAPRDTFYHWFIGDSMTHAFQIAGGRVSYRNRWVRTPNFRWNAPQEEPCLVAGEVR